MDRSVCIAAAYRRRPGYGGPVDNPGNHDQVNDRLTRLEEAHGFAAHDLDQLSGQVRQLFTLVEKLAKRLELAERRMQSLTEPDPEGAPPADPEI